MKRSIRSRTFFVLIAAYIGIAIYSCNTPKSTDNYQPGKNAGFLKREADKRVVTPTVDKNTSEKSDSVLPSSRFSCHEFMKFDDSVFTLARLSALLLEDSTTLVPRRLKGTFLNDTPIAVFESFMIDDKEVECCLLTEPFVRELLRHSEVPQFREFILKIRDIDLSTDYSIFKTDLNSAIKEIVEAYSIVKEYPGLLQVMCAEVNNVKIIDEDGQTVDGKERNVTTERITQIIPGLDQRVRMHQPGLMFWRECEIGGVTDLTVQLFRKIASIVDRALVQDDSLQLTVQVKAVPMYFDSRSFIDPDVESKSILDCHDTLIKHYFKDVVMAFYKDSVKVNDPLLLEFLQSSVSDFFNSEHTSFELVANGKEVFWMETLLAPQLTLKADDLCGDPLILVNLLPSVPSEQESILYAALPTEEYVKKGRKPSGFYPPKLVSVDSIPLNRRVQDNGYDSLLYEKKFTFAVPRSEKGIKTLQRADQHSISMGEQLLYKAILSVFMNNGSVVELLTSNFYGHDAFYSAMIGDPMMTDVNGDHLLDIVVDSVGGSRFLFIQKASGTFEKRVLRSYDSSGSGGC